MPFTPNANWVRALTRANVAPRFRGFIDLGGGATFPFNNGLIADDPSTPASLFSVTPFAERVDVIDRSLEVGGIQVEIEYDFIRDVIVNNRIKGKRLSLTLGAEDLLVADFQNYWNGVISGVFPDAKGQVVRLDCRSALEVLQQTKIVGFWTNDHPLDAMLDIIANKVGIDSTLYRAAAFDPDQSAYDDIAHHVVGRVTNTQIYSDMTVRDPTPAFDLIQELSEAINGALFINEDGELDFKYLDQAAAIDATWTENEIVEDLEQAGQSDDMVNQVAVNFRPVQGGHAEGWLTNDATSQSDHAFPGTAERITTQKVDTNWASAQGILRSDILIGAVPPFTIDVAGPGIFQMSGTSELVPGPQPARKGLAAGRPAYLRIGGEIFQADSVAEAFPGSFRETLTLVDPETGLPVTDGPYSTYIRYNIVLRSLFGSSAEAHDNGALVVDCTVPQHIGAQRLSRLRNGLETVKVSTLFDQYGIQMSDLVGIVWPEYLAFGKDGITAANKWEINSKQADLSADPPRILWELTNVENPTLTITQGTRLPSLNSSQNVQQLAGQTEANLERHVVNGLEITDGGGLTVDVAPGTASVILAQYTLGATVNLPVIASRDNYVYIDVSSGSLVQKDVVIAAAAPSIEFYEVLLGVVTTDGVGVTNLDDDGQPTRAMSGVRLVQQSVPWQDVIPVQMNTSSLNPNGDFQLITRG